MTLNQFLREFFQWLLFMAVFILQHLVITHIFLYFNGLWECAHAWPLFGFGNTLLNQHKCRPKIRVVVRSHGFLCRGKRLLYVFGLE